MATWQLSCSNVNKSRHCEKKHQSEKKSLMDQQSIRFACNWLPQTVTMLVTCNQPHSVAAVMHRWKYTLTQVALQHPLEYLNTTVHDFGIRSSFREHMNNYVDAMAHGKSLSLRGGPGGWGTESHLTLLPLHF